MPKSLDKITDKLPPLVTEDGEVLPQGVDATVDYIKSEGFPRFKTPWNHDTDLVALTTATINLEATKTQQHLAADTDINRIVAKFLQDPSQGLPNVAAPEYQDAKDYFDLQDNMVTRDQVDKAWNALPVAVRNMLRDPHTFEAYVTHCLETGDLSPLEEIGLAVKTTPPEPPKPPTPAGGAPAPAPAHEPPSGS